jgi:phosphopantothenoylcysteine synthetase/decarboxylase
MIYLSVGNRLRSSKRLPVNGKRFQRRNPTANNRMPRHFTLKGKRILITSGPTWVRLDDVRVISNVSSGAMGQLIAKECLKNGADVTLLQGPVQSAPKAAALHIKSFTFFEELEALLDEALKGPFDAIIHAAAIADYAPANAFAGKMRSNSNVLTLRLKRTKKLINGIRARQKKALLVGFKLEPSIKRDEAANAAQPLFDQAHCDLAVVNTRTVKTYTGFIVSKAGKILASGRSRQRIAKALVAALKDKL